MNLEHSRLRAESRSTRLLEAVPTPPLGAALSERGRDLARALARATEEALPVGARVGPYRILERLGAGGQASVYLAEDDAGRRLALKTPHRALAERLVVEAQILFHLDHPRVLRIERADIDAEPPYIATEYHPRSLAARLRDGPLSTKAAHRLAEQVLEALAYAHGKGVVHRDIKPSNILLTEDDDVKVCDFGIGTLSLVRRLGLSKTMATTGGAAIVGTPLYMAPEQEDPELLDGGDVDGRADLFALGKVLFEALTGRPPRTVRPVSVLVRGLSRCWDGFIFRLLEDRPEDRFASAEAARAALPSVEALLAGAFELDEHEEALAAALQCTLAAPPSMPPAATEAPSAEGEASTLAAAAAAAGLDAVDLDAVETDREARGRVPRAFASMYRVLPVAWEFGVLHVAVDDPGTARAGGPVDELRASLGCEVRVALASPAALTRALGRAPAEPLSSAPTPDPLGGMRGRPAPAASSRAAPAVRGDFVRAEVVGLALGLATGLVLAAGLPLGRLRATLVSAGLPIVCGALGLALVRVLAWVGRILRRLDRRGRRPSPISRGRLLPDADGVVVELRSLAAADADALLAELRRYRDLGMRRFCLDLAAIETIDSSGFGLLARCVDELRAAGGRVALLGLPAKARQVAGMLGLEAFFIAGDLEEARRRFSERGSVEDGPRMGCENVELS